jgi:hypothetical protein
MSNGLHLLLAGLLSRCYSLHVPGLSIPADIPSRVPSIAVGGNWVLDPVKVRAGKTGAADEDTLHKIAALWSFKGVVKEGYVPRLATSGFSSIVHFRRGQE